MDERRPFIMVEPEPPQRPQLVGEVLGNVRPPHEIINYLLARSQVTK